MTYLGAQLKSGARKKVRVPDLRDRKGDKKITALTCYDATFARLLEMTSLDCVLVVDSLGHVMQGGHSTIGVSVQDIAYHVRCVASRLKTPLLIADMPFGSVGKCVEQTFDAAVTLMQAGAEALKIEGATPEIASAIDRLVRHGIPVMGHIGLVPQSVHALGGYRVQGKDNVDSTRLINEAKILERAGCFGIVLELVVPDVAAQVTAAVQIPTIGIGCGKNCDGQILVLQDMLGMNLEFQPKFLKHFAKLEGNVTDAVEAYCSEVENGKFPS